MKVLNLYCGIGGNRKLWEGVEVTAVEINKDILDIVNKEFGNFTGHLEINPRVTFVNDEARSYIARKKDKYDIIQTSFIDTWAATESIPARQGTGWQEHRVAGNGFDQRRGLVADERTDIIGHHRNAHHVAEKGLGRRAGLGQVTRQIVTRQEDVLLALIEPVGQGPHVVAGIAGEIPV